MTNRQVVNQIQCGHKAKDTVGLKRVPRERERERETEKEKRRVQRTRSAY